MKRVQEYIGKEVGLIIEWNAIFDLCLRICERIM